MTLREKQVVSAYTGFLMCDKEQGCEKWECEYEERTPNRTETQELKQEFLRMASYIDSLLVCSDAQKETLINFMSRLSEYMPWYEDDDFEVEEHTPERTETHACDCGKKETHGDVIYRADALDALERIFNRCEEIEAHLPEGDPDRVGYKMYPDWLTVWKYLHQAPSTEPEIIRCKDCDWWEKQKDSVQGRCALMQMYPAGGWYCGNARRRENNEA